jgi:NAD(P)-dependent dehydrogenase (short-subunit alcohol dehydrogenase family)
MSAEAAKAYYAASAPTHPIGRVGTPQDIAEMVLFLADPSKAGQESSRNISTPVVASGETCAYFAGFITGTIMLVDGGRLLTSQAAPQISGAK